MRETAELVQAALALVGRSADVVESSYRELFAPLGIDPFDAPIETLARRARRYPHRSRGTRPRRLARPCCITHRLQPAFSARSHHARLRFPGDAVRAGEDPRWRSTGRRAFRIVPRDRTSWPTATTSSPTRASSARASSATTRADVQRGQRELPIDERLLAALPHMPACAGVALGIERLLMCLAGTDDIGDVIAFPFADA